MKRNDNGLLYGPEDKVSYFQSGLLGLQHVLAMDVYVPPIIIAGLLSMSLAQKTGFLQAAFLACGIGTILQTKYFMKLPVSQGPSFVPIGAVAGVYLANGASNGGMATVLGSLVVGAILLILLGISGIYQKIINTLVPAIVGGTIITCVGLSLLPSALNDNIFKATGNINQNIEIAAITALAMLIAITIGIRIPQLQRLFKVSSIIIALVVGTVVASMMGRFDWSVVNNAAWISLPHFTSLHYGIHFSLPAILTFVVIYMVLTTETTGTWFAMSAVVGEKITKKQWNRGIIGEGLSCLTAALLGTTPMTGYSTNAGVVSITGVASRRVFVSAGIWFIVLGFFGKLSAFLSAVPAAVIGGIFSIICVIIMLNGLNVIRNLATDESSIYVLGIPIVLTMAVILLPAKVVSETPQMIQYLLGSPITIAALSAIIINLVMGNRKVSESTEDTEEKVEPVSKEQLAESK
ncbi:solute carrier family 23 protein [Lentilactobacillus otakiensis]|uniref:uracil-xanthine permease family protein n=1 Tax=Lentilactobacillus otakiensis TaxID=481720 RepID=UPI001CBFF59A|nr:solute carrier family 23 protein [Lentilactobacillus otakiensis]MBZ3776382.1 purine/pyrimidine permease [Lentilactobacillus otakiensis]MDV3518509.1 solute carrier family 23 protein [Lentilactobacillus otakiensis]